MSVDFWYNPAEMGLLPGVFLPEKIWIRGRWEIRLFLLDGTMYGDMV